MFIPLYIDWTLKAQIFRILAPKMIVILLELQEIYTLAIYIFTLFITIYYDQSSIVYIDKLSQIYILKADNRLITTLIDVILAGNDWLYLKGNI